MTPRRARAGWWLLCAMEMFCEHWSRVPPPEPTWATGGLQSKLARPELLASHSAQTWELAFLISSLVTRLAGGSCLLWTEEVHGLSLSLPSMSGMLTAELMVTIYLHSV